MQNSGRCCRVGLRYFVIAVSDTLLTSAKVIQKMLQLRNRLTYDVVLTILLFSIDADGTKGTLNDDGGCHGVISLNNFSHSLFFQYLINRSATRRINHVYVKSFLKYTLHK